MRPNPLDELNKSSSDKSATRLLPKDMMAATKSTYDSIEQVVDGLKVSDADKSKIKTAIKHNLYKREQQILNDVNELQRRTKFGTPKTVGKQLKEAVETQVVDYYNQNRTAFVDDIVNAFNKVGKAEEIRQVLTKDLVAKEEQLFETLRKQAPEYVKTMHAQYLAESHNEFMATSPFDYSGISGFITSVASNSYTEFRRFWNSSYFKKKWQLDIDEKNKHDQEVELEFGKAIDNEYFGFHLKAPKDIATPRVDRKFADFMFNVFRGNWVEAVNPQSNVGKLVWGALTYLNPLFWVSSLIWWGTGIKFDANSCFEAVISFNPKNDKTATSEITMPKYYTWFPFNNWPYNYPQKVFERDLQARAAEGYIPNINTLPEKYRKHLVIWGLKHALWTAEDIGLDENHPWRKAGEAQRIRFSKAIGRAESIDYKLNRTLEMRKIPELPEEDKKPEDALKIKAKADPTKKDEAVHIKHPPLSDADTAAHIRGHVSPRPPSDDAVNIRGRATPDTTPRTAVEIKARKPHRDPNNALHIHAKAQADTSNTADTNPSARSLRRTRSM